MAAASNPSRVREIGAWRRWLWLLWALAAAAALAVSAALLASRITVGSRLHYPGILRSTLRQADLELPQSVPLQEMLVQAGDTVKPGQTLAVYDTGLLDELLADTERQILAGSIERKCLTSGTPPGEAAMEAGTLEAEAGLQAERAAAECAALLNRHRVQRRRVEAALEAAGNGSGTRIRRLKSAVAKAETDSQRNLIATQIAVERNRLKQRSGRLGLELAALRSDQEHEVLARLRRLEEEAALLRQRRARLRQALEQPRLLAPMGGRITRLRTVAAGQSFPQPVPLISLRSEASRTVEASFSLPEQEARALAPGGLVSMRLPGRGGTAAALAVPVLFKEPLDIGRGGSRLVRIHLDIGAEHLSGLQLDLAGKSFTDANSASEISISGAPSSLAGILAGQAAGLAAASGLAGRGARPGWLPDWLSGAPPRNLPAASAAARSM